MIVLVFLIILFTMLFVSTGRTRVVIFAAMVGAFTGLIFSRLYGGVPIVEAVLVIGGAIIFEALAVEIMKM